MLTYPGRREGVESATVAKCYSAERKESQMDSYTHIAVVLDRSGSMQIVQDDTIGGFNQFLVDQLAVDGKATITLAQFDDVYELLLDMVDLADAQPLNKDTFVPRGMTALLDAIGKTINSVGAKLAAMTESDRPEKVVFAIITDGQENASRTFDRAKVFEMIRHQEDKYQWQFVFIGANQDAIDAGGSIGISAMRCLTYKTTSIGTQNAYASLGATVSSYRAGAQTGCGFTDEDRKKQEEDT
jgi:uncharacterized protein YegL